MTEQMTPGTGKPDVSPDDRARHAQILETARKRFSLVASTETNMRLKMLEDLKFFSGSDQWREEDRRVREDDGRPCLTFPVIKQFVHQVTNEIRQNKPAPLVTPVDDKGDVDTAETLMGILRHIERQSKADTARSYAALYAVICGRGWYRIVTDYETDSLSEDAGVEAFDQDIYVRRIKNQSSVYSDPAAQEPDYSDMKWCFIVEDLLTDDFKAKHPHAQVASLEEFSSIGDYRQNWCPEADTIRVAEYFYIEHEPVKVALIWDEAAGGVVLPLDEVPEGAQVLKQRTVKRKTVRWCKMTGLEVLEERIWPGQWIPVVPVLGEELFIDGETLLTGMVRDAKHAQVQYNYMRTQQTEAIALAPRAPYVAAVGQVEEFPEWRDANKKNYSVLRYRPMSVGNEAVPPPQRQQFEPAIQAMTLAVTQAYEDLKRATGIHDDSLGARSNADSGRAILARQAEGDTANFHYLDAVTTAITHECRIEVDLIPHIYDRPGRVARIIGEEGDDQTRVLNQPVEQGGITKIYDVRTGRYDVAVTVGPSYTTKRQQMGDMLMQLTKAYPALMEVAGDVVIKSLDIPGAQEIGERLKKLLPAAVQDGDGQAPIPPQVQAQLVQLQQLVSALSQELEAASEEIKVKKIETDSRERIEAMKVQADLTKTQAQLMTTGGIELLRQEIATIQSQLDRALQREQFEEQQKAKASAAEQSGGSMPLAA